MRLIDAEALQLPFLNPSDFDDPEWAKGWNIVVKILEYATTVDPVKHGKWEVGSTEYGDCVRCSNCLHEGGSILTNYNYCPFCGAKMERDTT